MNILLISIFVLILIYITIMIIDNQWKVVNYRKGGKPRKLIYENKDDFTETEQFDNLVDVRRNVKVGNEVYLTKDYTQNVEWAFPKLNELLKFKIKLNKEFANWSHSKLTTFDNETHYNIMRGENKHWTNKQLSYMRKRTLGCKILQKVFYEMQNIMKSSFPKTWIDSTANIGGETINLAISEFCEKLIAYEIDSDVFKMLQNNIELFKLTWVTAINKAVTLETIETFPENCGILLDPPFETSNNNGNFNFSIIDAPLETLILHLMKRAKFVLINLPTDFTMNLNAFKNTEIKIKVYHFNKAIKIYVAYCQ